MLNKDEVLNEEVKDSPGPPEDSKLVEETDTEVAKIYNAE